MDYKDIAEQSYKNGYAEGVKTVAEKLFDFLDDYALFDKRFLERKINDICKEVLGEKK